MSRCSQKNSLLSRLRFFPLIVGEGDGGEAIFSGNCFAIYKIMCTFA